MLFPAFFGHVFLLYATVALNSYFFLLYDGESRLGEDSELRYAFIASGGFGM